MNYWIHSVKDEKERDELLEIACELNKNASPKRKGIGQRFKNFFLGTSSDEEDYKKQDRSSYMYGQFDH